MRNVTIHDMLACQFFRVYIIFFTCSPIDIVYYVKVSSSSKMQLDIGNEAYLPWRPYLTHLLTCFYTPRL